jgi:choline kinase
MLRAILLAAGSGRRLGVSHPKCLLRFGARSLLERHIDALARLGIEELAIVTGYERAQIEKELAQRSPQPTLLFNPEYARGSAVSLWRAREWLQKGDDVLLMDADVLYDPALLGELAACRSNALLLDRDYDDRAGEAMKVCLERGRIVEFRKQLAADLHFDDVGESVGFFRLSADSARSLAWHLERYVGAGRVDEPYEEPLRELMLESPQAFEICDATGAAWIEIDFPSDVDRARVQILPRLLEGERLP